jgi:glycosyltransferase involved in cell wall biosynthesis
MFRTLHLTNAWHGSSGGVATFYRALLKAAPASGCQMRLVVPAGTDRVEEPDQWTRIYYVAARRARLNPAYRLISPSSYLLPGGAVRRIIAAEEPDLIEVCDKFTLPYLAGLLRTRRLPGIGFRPATVGLSCERLDDNVRAYLGHGAAGARFSRWYMKWIYFPMFDHHITVSGYTAEELREAARGHKRQRGVWVRGMGVDAGLFTPLRRSAELRRRLMWLAAAPDDAVLVFYAGRLVPEKNPWLLLDTMAALASRSERPFRLLIAGDGILREALRREAERRLPGMVAFLDHIRDRESLAAHYASCDVFLHPNPNEPFGIAPLEAMASGLALVAPDSGGVLSYADSTNAWLARPEPAAMAEAVLRAAPGSPGRGEKLAAARRAAERLDWPRVAAGFFELYRDLARSVRGERSAPALPPSFVSTPGNWLGMEV